MAFSDKVNLGTYRRTHSGENLYMCVWSVGGSSMPSQTPPAGENTLRGKALHMHEFSSHI